MRTIEVKMGENPHITEEDYKNGVILKFVGEMPPNSRRMEKHIRIYLDRKPIRTETVQVPITPTIPGHPNCHYGDCDKECHVVSCPIYQEYEPVPMLPHDYQYEYKTVEVPIYD